VLEHILKPVTRIALAEDCFDQGEYSSSVPSPVPCLPVDCSGSIGHPWNCLAICFFFIAARYPRSPPIRPKPAALLHPSTRQSLVLCDQPRQISLAVASVHSFVGRTSRRVRWLASFASVLADGGIIRVRATSSCSLSKTKVGPRKSLRPTVFFVFSIMRGNIYGKPFQ